MLRLNARMARLRAVSMPSMSGWVLRGTNVKRFAASSRGFYALDVGLGVARHVPSLPWPQLKGRFYALDVGLGVARDASFRCL